MHSMQEASMQGGTSGTEISQHELYALLQDQMQRYGVPGAQIGILDSSDADHPKMLSAYAGVISTATQYPVLADTVFQIGSLSKIWTTMLAFQLIDEHKLDLDTSIEEVLGSYELRGSIDFSKHCTIRHLMNHTSGIEGDVFPRHLGRGDDCVERYVRYISDFPARTSVGGPLSYSNGAFVVLGRIVEVLRSMTWDEAIKQYIAHPAGFDSVCTLPEDVLLRSSALGHVRAVANDVAINPPPVQSVDVWQLPRCVGPCGSVSACIKDVLGFASIFLNGGVAPNGVRLLSESATHAMTSLSVSLASQGIENIGWALGWQLPNWGKTQAFGHSGATEGQRAYLVVFPERQTALCVLTNADSGSQMSTTLSAEVTRRWGIEPRPEVLYSNEPIDDATIHDLLGTYRRYGVTFYMIAGGETGIQVVFEPEDDDGPYGTRLTVSLFRSSSGHFLVQRPDRVNPTEIAVITTVDGTQYAAIDHRLTPKVSSDTAIPDAVPVLARD